MKVFPRKARYDRDLMNQNKVLLEIDMGGRVEGNLLQDFSALGMDEDLLAVLKTFNKSIIGVDTISGRYVVLHDMLDHRDGPSKLGFSRLSTGERLFAICFMAVATKTHIIVCEEVGQLDMTHLKMFLDMWIDSPYLDVISPATTNSYIFKTLYDKRAGTNVRREGT